jgi:hypothetical protein
MIQFKALVLLCVLAAGLAFVASSCSSSYFSTWDSFGVGKRDMLISRVGQARDEETQAAKEFERALKRFRELLAAKPGDLKDKYSDLKSAYADCEYRAGRVADRVEDIEDFSESMFNEWRDQLDEFESETLRSASETQMNDTNKRYAQMIAVTQRAGTAMKTALGTFRDQRLFLEQDLSAQSIATLRGQSETLEGDLATLQSDLGAAIKAADEFLAAMPKN